MKFYIVYLNLLDDDITDFPGIHKDTTLPIIHHNDMRFIMYAITDDKSALKDFMKIRDPNRFLVSEKNEDKTEYTDLFCLYEDLNIGIRSIHIHADNDEFPFMTKNVTLALTYNEFKALGNIGRQRVLDIVLKIPEDFVRITKQKYYEAFQSLLYSSLLTDSMYDDLPFNYIEFDDFNVALLIFHNILNKELLELYTELGLNII